MSNFDIEIDADAPAAGFDRLRREIGEKRHAANGNASHNAAGAKQSATPEQCNRLKPYDLHDLIALDIPPRRMIVDPAIPEKGLVMLYAPRGVGKTHMVCGLSYAISTGTPFLKWTVPGPRKVLHVDGEMPATDLRERFERIMAGSTVKPAKGMLNVLTADLIDLGIGNLASPKVQAELDPWLEGVSYLTLDNLSSLTTIIRDNEAESWTPIQEWLLRLRRRGISVLFAHHANKDGGQRGTSRREDVLDTSLLLRRPEDYTPEQGARFIIQFEKARGIYGDSAKPFEAKFEVRDGAAFWTTHEIEDLNRARVKALLDDGMTIRDIADETGIPKSTVGRIKKSLDGVGQIITPVSQAGQTERVSPVSRPKEAAGTDFCLDSRGVSQICPVVPPPKGRDAGQDRAGDDGDPFAQFKQPSPDLKKQERGR